jgi:hypothetical protein
MQPQVQSVQEMNFVYEYWAKNLAPKGYIDKLANTNTMVDELLKRGTTVVTFTILTEVCKALGKKSEGGVIEFEGESAPAPAAPEPAKQGWKRGPRPDNKVDVDDERQRFVKDLYDINTPLFLRTQDEARLELEKAIDRASTTYNTRGKVDHALTTHRRNQLKAIHIVHPEKNDKGQTVTLYTEMLAEVRRMAKEFDREDARRNDQIR